MRRVETTGRKGLVKPSESIPKRETDAREKGCHGEEKIGFARCVYFGGPWYQPYFGNVRSFITHRCTTWTFHKVKIVLSGAADHSIVETGSDRL